MSVTIVSTPITKRIVYGTMIMKHSVTSSGYDTNSDKDNDNENNDDNHKHNSNENDY